jgi:hypothetical protein
MSYYMTPATTLYAYIYLDNKCREIRSIQSSTAEIRNVNMDHVTHNKGTSYVRYNVSLHNKCLSFLCTSSYNPDLCPPRRKASNTTGIIAHKGVVSGREKPPHVWGDHGQVKAITLGVSVICFFGTLFFKHTIKAPCIVMGRDARGVEENKVNKANEDIDMCLTYANKMLKVCAPSCTSVPCRWFPRWATSCLSCIASPIKSPNTGPPPKGHTDHTA